MSSTRTGNFLGIVFCALGIFVCGWATYQGLPTGYFWGGLALAVGGAGLWRPKDVSEGVHALKDNAGELKGLIDGRRSGDTSEVKIAVKKDQAGD